ncbi:hypothetical protein HMPREF1083_05689 [[Clostridium] clostridioforme 90A6]|uniref:Uncharacterized protein n=1 Tax=[Clostridium] clostridioforme 90A6 TaxID=999406 RepID=R0AZS7_9FIRM|nr:hypothetical protein [Enterocloster clostridioformis]ENZ57661.1 hypothetical protein HMPREF1083_05689 [[Clostridium] clostridioforme 90A6]
MATVDEILARQAYADGDETWTKDNNYPSYTLYVEPEYVPVTNKRIADFNDQISVRGEQNAQFVGFQLPRCDDGLDLTAQHLYIHYQTVYGGGDGVPCNVSKSDSHVRMCWKVPAQATQEPGTIQMMIYATGTNSARERVTWKTLPASYTIHDGLEIGGGIPEPDQSWYEQFVAQMEGKVSTAQGYANDAQASKTAAADSASASAQSATASAKALEDNKAYVESQKETFVGYNKRETDLKYANALIGSASGTTQVTVDDAWEGPIPGLEIAGKSEQGADPSPEYPQEIVSTDVTAVTVTGANLFDDTTLMAYGNTTFVLSADRRQVTITGDKNYACAESDTPAQLIAGKNVTVSCNISNKNSEVPVEFQLYIEFPDGTKNYLHHKSSGSKTFSIPDNITKAIFKLFVNLKNANLDSKNTVVYSDVMVNIGTTPLPWEPYQSKTASIILAEPLRGIGDYRDEITMTNRIDRCMELTFDGSEDCWGVYTSGSRTGFSAINVLPISMNNQNGICNQALVGGNEEAERIVLGSNNQNLYYFYCPFYDATVADKGLSAWKAHLAAHPLKVVTYLDTPAETDLGADTIAALAELTTYKGRTTTTVTAEGPEPDVTLEYVQDTRMVIADLQAQINEIRNGGTT